MLNRLHGTYMKLANSLPLVKYEILAMLHEKRRTLGDARSRQGGLAVNRGRKNIETLDSMLSFTERSLFRPSVLQPYVPMTQITKYWMPVILYAGLIAFLSSLSSPGIKIPSLFYGLDDKIIHAVEYAILAILCYRAYRWTFVKKLVRYASLLAIVTAILFGITDEIHQAFVPFRHPDVWDLVADAVGSFLGVAAWKWYLEPSVLEPSS